MESLLNREFAESLHARLSRDLSAACIHCQEIDSNEDASMSERMEAGCEVERLVSLIDQLELAMALQSELEKQGYC